MTMTIGFHGAARTVTGSCLEVTAGGRRILLDCGLFQGTRSLEALNHELLPFKPAALDAVILSHAHIDHCGLLPKLVAQGYAGPIWCTPETADLLEFMLADAGRIQEYEAERRNRRRDRAGDVPFEAIYTEADALAAWRLARPVALDDWFTPVGDMRARFWNAGHILGAASIELEGGGVRLMYSGDIGPENKAFLPQPQGAVGFDHVICELTYGDRARERVSIEERRNLLAAEIRAALKAGGNLVIPAFALERTQELLLDIATLSSNDQIGGAMVFVDSPLANRATGVFRKYVRGLQDTAGRDVFAHPSIHYVHDATELMRLNTIKGAIIIAASGMCEAGRIRHHLLHNLPRRELTILFVGFQAAGSLGQIIQNGARRVRISGQDVAVRARIHSIDSYSAHADQGELLDWMRDRGPVSGSIFLDHGEEASALALARLVESERLAPSVIVPEIGEQYELSPGQPAQRLQTGRQDLRQVIARDWQNDYADLATNLKQRLGRIKDPEARRQAVAAMRQVLDGYDPAQT